MHMLNLVSVLAPSTPITNFTLIFFFARTKPYWYYVFLISNILFTVLNLNPIMSMFALKGPDFSRTSSYGIPTYYKLQRTSPSWIIASSKSIPTQEEIELSQKVHKLTVPEIDKSSPSTIKFDRLQRTDEAASEVDKVEFGQFVAREAQLDEEYWTAAWLRAESLWEGRENDRYADNYKRKFAEQEFNSLKKRCNAQLGEKCTCIVTVKKEDKSVKRTILKSVVGTLDLSIRYLSHGETFPGEQVNTSLFCLVDRKSSSRYGYIANLCVAKSARRQGIARNMLQFAINEAKENGAEKVFVHVHRHNKAAQILYQNMGFEVVNEASSQLSADQTYLFSFQP